MTTRCQTSELTSCPPGRVLWVEQRFLPLRRRSEMADFCFLDLVTSKIFYFRGMLSRFHKTAAAFTCRQFKGVTSSVRLTPEQQCWPETWFSLSADSDYSHQDSFLMWVMGLGLGLWENLRVTPAAVTMTPIIAPSTRYRTKMAADDETDLPAPPTHESSLLFG